MLAITFAILSILSVPAAMLAICYADSNIDNRRYWWVILATLMFFICTAMLAISDRLEL